MRNDQGKYPFAFEISGILAAFCQSDAWPYSITYPFPTLSACEGMVKNIAVISQARAVVTRLEICKPVRYYDYSFLNTTVNRFNNDGCDRLTITCLFDVCYRIYGHTRSLPSSGTVVTTNPAHAYQEILLRRIKQGKYRCVPCLGPRDFTPSYFGEFRPNTTVQPFNLVVPHMTVRTFSSFKGNGVWSPVEAPVVAKDGVVDYADFTTNC